MEFATKEQLLGKACQRQFSQVPVPGIGVVRLRSLTELERQRFRQGLLDEDGEPDQEMIESAGARLMQMTIAEHDGDKLMFATGEEALLGDMMGCYSAVIVEAAEKLCGMRRDDKAVETAAKNSSETGAD